MRLRNKKQLPEMTRSNQGTGAANATSTSGTGTNPPNSQNDMQMIPTSSVPSSGAPSSTVAPASQAIPTSGTVASTTQAMPSVRETSNQGFWNFGTVSHRSVPPGRPTSSMLGLHTSQANSSQICIRNYHRCSLLGSPPLFQRPNGH